MDAKFNICGDVCYLFFYNIIMCFQRLQNLYIYICNLETISKGKDFLM